MVLVISVILCNKFSSSLKNCVRDNDFRWILFCNKINETWRHSDVIYCRSIIGASYSFAHRVYNWCRNVFSHDYNRYVYPPLPLHFDTRFYPADASPAKHGGHSLPLPPLSIPEISPERRKMGTCCLAHTILNTSAHADYVDLAGLAGQVTVTS